MSEKKKFSILIVDDSGANLRLLSNILKSDYNILSAKNGFDAIQAAVEKQPDVILLDILMPNIDGYEVITVLKNDERTREIPVIFITALDDPFDEEKGLSLQAADYIGKPFTPAIVKLRVRNQIQFLQRLRAAKEARGDLSERRASDTAAPQELSPLAEAEAKGLYFDQFAGTYNRQFFEEYITSVFGRLAGENGVLSLMIIDIDRFEEYCEAFGREAGEECLKRVAGALKSCVMNEDDFISRYGGGAFVAALPNADKYGARLVARKMLHAVRELDIPRGHGDCVTVSIGAVADRVQQAYGLDDFLELAGDMLRISKKDGGNRYTPGGLS